MGIYSRAETLEEHGGSFFMATFVDDVFMTWFDSLGFPNNQNPQPHDNKSENRIEMIEEDKVEEIDENDIS